MTENGRWWRREIGKELRVAGRGVAAILWIVGLVLNIYQRRVSTGVVLSVVAAIVYLAVVGFDLWIVGRGGESSRKIE